MDATSTGVDSGTGSGAIPEAAAEAGDEEKSMTPSMAETDAETEDLETQGPAKDMHTDMHTCTYTGTDSAPLPSSPFLSQIKDTIQRSGGNKFATWYDERGMVSEESTFEQLWHEAGIISYHLRQEWGVKKGKQVILCYNFGLHFFASFLGCLRANVAAVLVYPPGPPLAKSLLKMSKVIDDCSPVLILTDTAIATLKTADEINPMSISRHLWPKQLEFKITNNLKSSLVFDEAEIAPTDLAFLQYTSGSTGDPKGVMVTHKALQANVHMIHRIHERIHKPFTGDAWAGFSWLPQYHDLGLIYAVIAPFAGGWRMHLMSPITFIKKPLLWLELMSKKRVYWSVAPDFAYQYVTRKFLEAKANGKEPIPGLDLSCVKRLASAAEPIRVDTAPKFSEAFSEYGLGLAHDWFYGAYGLAESVVYVSFIDRYQLSTQRSQDQSSFVAVGSRDILDQSVDLKIVNPDTLREVEDNQTGELWVAGPSITDGYYGKPELYETEFRAKLVCDGGATSPSNETYLRTGDLAFFQNDFLYICGRIKDLIIVNGVNYYPQDIEQVVQTCSSAVRPGCVAAFSSNDNGGENNEGQLEVVFEIRQQSQHKASQVCLQVKTAISQHIGIVASKIIALEERAISKTTSGKIQRKRNRFLLHSGQHKVVFALASSSMPNWTPTQSLVSEDALRDDELYDRIISSFLGEDYHPSLNWEENGLTSMLEIELANHISECFPIVVPSDFVQRYPTPKSLEVFISRSKGGFFPIKILEYKNAKTSLPISWVTATLLQTFGALTIFFFIAVSCLPVYSYLYYIDSLNGVGWQALAPLSFVVWHFCFTLLVICSKWAVIGVYDPCQVAIPSYYYARWWFVDRLVCIWEILTGPFIVDTGWLWLVYRLMGTKMGISARANAYLREFDLIEIGNMSDISSDIKCRKFGPWEDSGLFCGYPTMRLAPIVVGDHCRIKGHLGPGVRIGNGSLVEKLASVPEGATIPPGVSASGSPAHQAGLYVANKNPPFCSRLLGMTKVVWPFVELYLMAVLTYVVNFLLAKVMSKQAMNLSTESLLAWEFEILLYWFLMIFGTGFLGFWLTIPLKWILIGRRKPRPIDAHHTIHEMMDWMVDYHFTVTALCFKMVAEHSLLVNLVLKAMGMKIDWMSKAWIECFPPSKVDLITIQESNVSIVDIDLLAPNDGRFERVEIRNSNIGHSVVIVGGVTVESADIHPFAMIKKDVVGSQDVDAPQETLSTASRWIITAAIFPATCLLFLSFVPAYDVYHRIGQYSTTSMPEALDFALRLAIAFVVFCLSWFTVLVWMSFLSFPPCTKLEIYSKPWFMSLYMVFFGMHEHLWYLSLLPIFWGTKYFNLVLRIMGSNVQGDLLYFGKIIYDCPMVTFLDKTIVDDSLCTGHFARRRSLHLATTIVSGVLHRGTICLGKTNMTGVVETTPMKYIPPPTAPPQGRHDVI